MTPLSPARYKVQFTASAELRDKLERLQALTREDLAEVIEAAVTEKLERLESKRFGLTKSPRKSMAQTDTRPSSRYLPAPVRRIVRKRDGNQCTFVNRKGIRCTERRGLEFHHRKPYGRGGAHSPDNVCVMCRQHNAYLAERDYGREYMQKFRRDPDRVSEGLPDYGDFERRSRRTRYVPDRRSGRPRRRPAPRRRQAALTCRHISPEK